MPWDFAEATSEEVARQRALYEPLTDSIRQLIDASIRTETDEDVVAAAKAEVDSATAKLRSLQRDGGLGMSLTPDGEPVAWGNVAIGPRNPLAPPLDVQDDGENGAHVDFELGPAYEGAPGQVHGGYCALVLDHLFGHVASHSDPRSVAATGTISFRYERPTMLGRLHAQAEIQRTEGRKIFVVGHLADADGVTVSGEGLFIAINKP